MLKAIIIITLTVLCWLFLPFLLNTYVLPIYGMQTTETSGIYTAIAALFSALAFAVLILTLISQRQLINIQKQEISSAQETNNKNTELAAYTALLTYYANNSYEPNACELTSMDIAKKLNAILKSST